MKAIKYLAWFVAGQVIQVILSILAKVSFMSRPIWFCVAAGFLLTIAIIAGTKIKEEEKPKSYLDYANRRETD